MTYDEILHLCEFYFGDDWWHEETGLFYPEFIGALIPGTCPFRYLAQLKHEQGHSSAQLSMNPIYGFFVNIAGSHRYMELMASAFLREEISLPRKQQDALDRLEEEAWETFHKPKTVAKRIGKKILPPLSKYARYIWYYYL